MVDTVRARLERENDYYSNLANELLQDERVSIERLLDAFKRRERHDNHEHHQTIKIHKIDHDRYTVTAHGAHMGTLNGRTFKVVCALAAGAGVFFTVSGIGQIAPLKFADAVNWFSETARVGTVIDVSVGAAALAASAAKVENFARAVELGKSIPDGYYNAEVTRHRTEHSTLESRKQFIEQDLQRHGERLSQQGQENAQDDNRWHDFISRLLSSN